MDRAQIEKTLREIVVKRVRDLKPEAVTLDIELVKLGVDSLAFSWILADMEDAFGFVMQGADIMKLKTLASAIDYVQKQIGATQTRA